MHINVLVVNGLSLASHHVKKGNIK